MQTKKEYNITTNLFGDFEAANITNAILQQQLKWCVSRLSIRGVAV